MLRAEIDIHALTPSGETMDFAKYVFNDFNMSKNVFKEHITKNAERIAQNACYDGEELDFVCVTDIIFEEVSL